MTNPIVHPTRGSPLTRQKLSSPGLMMMATSSFHAASESFVSRTGRQPETGRRSACSTSNQAISGARPVRVTAYMAQHVFHEVTRELDLFLLARGSAGHRPCFGESEPFGGAEDDGAREEADQMTHLGREFAADALGYPGNELEA